MRVRTTRKPIALVAALAILPFAPQALAASDVALGNAGLTARASIDVQITVPRVAKLQLLGHPSSIAVTSEDIARGHVMVSGASIDLVVNDPHGYELKTELRDANFTAVHIAGLPAQVVATNDAPVTHMPSMVGRPRPRPASVEYELDLAPTAQPGTYAWPVALSLQTP